jgi:hypothetical protein
VNPPDRARIEDELGRIFDGIFRLSDPELRMIRTIWESEDEEARQKAFQTARATIDARHRRDLLDDAQSTMRQWIGSYLTATTAEYGGFLTGARAGMDVGEVRRDLVPPLIDAVVAIIAADGLEADERELLLEPVTQVIAQHGLAND